MKKSIILTLAILPSIVLVSMACTTYEPVFSYSLTVTVDKTEAHIGDTVTATVVWKNLNEGSDIEVELPYWIVNKGGKSKRDMLYSVFTTNEDFDWRNELESYDNTPVKRPKFLIKKDEEIKRTFKHTITEPEDLYIYAAAFIHYGDQGGYDKLCRNYYPEKIIVNNEQ